MKRLILLILLFLNFVIYSQSKNHNSKIKKLAKSNIEVNEKSVTFLTEKDFKNKFDTLYISKKIYVNDANEDLILTNFDFISPKKKLDFLTVNELNRIIHKSNLEVMFDVKNKYTYIPKKISIYFIEKENRWYVNIKYTVQNDYGATTDGTCLIRYSSDGFLYDKNNF